MDDLSHIMEAILIKFVTALYTDLIFIYFQNKANLDHHYVFLCSIITMHKKNTY